jgi:hypothetical protein
MGSLHLTLKHTGDSWTCAEVFSASSFGYGSYRWRIGTDVASLDPELVFALFTYSHAPDQAHREMDVEFARWGDPEAENAQYVVQPFGTSGHVERFDLPGMQGSTHELVWCPDRVEFRSRGGDGTGPILHAWTFDRKDEIPQPGGENVRMNLYTAAGKPPMDGREVEVVVQGFEFAACCPACHRVRPRCRTSRGPLRKKPRSRSE